MKRGTLGYITSLNPDITKTHYENARMKLSLDDLDRLALVEDVLDTIEALYPIATPPEGDHAQKVHKLLDKMNTSHRILRDERFARCLEQAKSRWGHNKQLMKVIVYSVAMRRAQL